jgi:hypothetical protein
MIAANELMNYFAILLRLNFDFKGLTPVAVTITTSWKNIWRDCVRKMQHLLADAFVSTQL